mmetsp:Transcript_40838/g.39429  ORF Transcript_40838/g.39429 Transcript_40838/m.39429 type:complete len:120 (+) Transcript_40838:242-601(+)
MASDHNQMLTPYVFLLFNKLIVFEGSDHCFEPELLDLLVHVILHPPVGVGLLPHRVRKQEPHVVLHLLNQRDCLLELFLRLSAEPTDEVTRQCNSWNFLANVSHQLQVSFSSMIPSHPL